MSRYFVGITGASGHLYAERLITRHRPWQGTRSTCP